MGLFDTVKIDVDLLPVTSAEKTKLVKEEFQSKDYVPVWGTQIRFNGKRLEILEYDLAVVPEDERPHCKDKPPEQRTDFDKMIGSFKHENEKWVDLEQDEPFNFYTGCDGEWFEFNAIFKDGDLVRIEREMPKEK